MGKEQHHIKKLTGEEIIVYASAPISHGNISYFKVRVEETELGLISIGVFTESKLRSGMDCGYC